MRQALSRARSVSCVDWPGTDMSFIDDLSDYRAASEKLGQLDVVFSARRVRLDNLRKELFARLKDIQQLLVAVAQDETLVLKQQRAWAKDWANWQLDGGTIVEAKRWIDYRRQIDELAKLVRARKQDVMNRLESLKGELATLNRKCAANDLRSEMVSNDKASVLRLSSAAQSRALDDAAEERAGLVWYASSRSSRQGANQ